MRVNIEFLGLPNLIKMVGAKQTELTLDQGTLKEALDCLVTKFGSQVKDDLFDSQGKLDLSIQVLLNQKDWLSSDQMDIKFKEGDTISLMMMVAGG